MYLTTYVQVLGEKKVSIFLPVAFMPFNSKSSFCLLCPVNKLSSANIHGVTPGIIVIMAVTDKCSTAMPTRFIMFICLEFIPLSDTGTLRTVHPKHIKSAIILISLVPHVPSIEQMLTVQAVYDILKWL